MKFLVILANAAGVIAREEIELEGSIEDNQDSIDEAAGRVIEGWTLSLGDTIRICDTREERAGEIAALTAWAAARQHAMQPYAPQYGTPLEHAITRALLEELAVDGYQPAEVWDGGAYVPATDEKAVLDAVFSVYTSTIHFAKNGERERNRGVLMIVGNGEALISDYHCGDKVFSDAIERVYARLDGYNVALRPRRAT